MDDSFETVGDLIRYIRGERSQNRFAIEVGVTQKTVSKWEQNIQNISEFYLQGIAAREHIEIILSGNGYKVMGRE